MRGAALACLVAAALPCAAQRVRVVSPLTRIDPWGQVVKADRGTAQPRHILSPGIPRNAYSSLRVVVEMDKPGNYILDIGQNPDNAVTATLYKEIFVETADGWIPDSLQLVQIPHRGFATDFSRPKQTVVTFWLDMWVKPDAEVDRIKVEPQLWVESMQDWVIYPMEVRVQSPVVPKMAPTFTPSLPPVTAPADAAARAPLAAALCGAPAEKTGPKPQAPTARDLLRRNVMQHIALAGDRAKLAAAFTKATGETDPAKWCAAPGTPPAGPEWYLRFRDLLYKQSGAVD